MIGRIIKGIGGFYTVRADGRQYTVKARGKFRIKGGKPIIGDVVEFDPNEGIMTQIQQRKNEFIRPCVANMTQVGIVLSPSPAPDFLLIDKLLVQCAAADLAIFMVLNKCELAERAWVEELSAMYRQYTFFCCSTYAEIGLDVLPGLFHGQDTFLAGQSGVGKSSLLNAAFPALSLETGAISSKLERGKHTTRHVEMIPLPEGESYVVDTPGFSYFDLPKSGTPPEVYYREFEPYRGRCRFIGCRHDNEPDCAVKAQVGKGIDEKRYARYLIIQKEWEEQRRRQYD